MIEKIIEYMRNDPGGLATAARIGTAIILVGGATVVWRLLKKHPKPSELDIKYEKAIDRIYEVASFCTNKEKLRGFIGDLERVCDEYTKNKNRQ